MIKDNILPLLIIIGGLILFIFFLPESKFDQDLKKITIGTLVVGTIFGLLMESMNENNSNEKEIKSLNNELEKLRLQKSKNIKKKNKSNPKSSR